MPGVRPLNILEFVMDLDTALKFLPLLTALITLGLSWLVGSRISAEWALRQKRREGVQLAVATFQGLYGRWFALAKLWLLHKVACSSEESPTRNADREWALLRDIIALEGEFEAFWLKLSAQYALPPATLDTMERFREGFQVLRRTAVSGEGLDWFRHNDIQYRAFKTLAAEIVSALGSEQIVAETMQAPHTAAAAFHRVTSNRVQQDWFMREDIAA
jgi:hypothetical protein